MVLEFCSPSCTMPFETMGQRGLSTPPCFLEEVSVCYEKELGFWKPKVMHYDQGTLSVDSLELPLSYVAKEKGKRHIDEEEKTPKFSRALGEYINNSQKGSPTLYMQPVSDSAETNETNLNGTRYWSCLPSSTLSEVFGRQLGLSTNVLFHKTADTVASCYEEEEPFGSIKDIEAQTIGNLLPDEDDIFSGMIDGLEYVADAKEGDAEDFDLFSSVGGMELGVDDVSYVNQRDADFAGGVLKGWWSPNGSPATHPHGEHPSITLFVGNVNSNVEDSELRVLFEQYGDIRNLYTACKHQGFVMISYFDIRAARNAMIALQNKMLRGQKLVIHYSIPKDYPLKKCSELGQDKTGLLISSGDKSSSESTSTFSHEGRTLGCFNNGSVQGLHSASHVPLSALTENAFSDGTFCVLNSLPSSLRTATAGSHFGLHKPGHSLDQVKFGSQRIPICHPHSSPDCQDNCKICIPHNTLSTFASMASKIGSTVLDRMNGRHTCIVDSNGQPIEHKGGISEPTGNVTYHVHGHHWSNRNLFELQPSSPIVWQISPLFSSGVNAPRPPHLPGFSGMPPDMLNTVSLPHNPHVGSALPINPSLRDRQHAYKRESPEDLAFCLGSFGSVGFPGGSPLHLLGGASRIFSHSGESCMEKARNDALPYPHHFSHICPDRKTVTSLPNSFGSPREYGRNLSHRRNQGSSNHADKKQFELDIDHILHGEDSRTTLMIKNIPNKYTSKMLLAAIDDHSRGTYDFIYLPIDFKNKCNVGYAFINLIDPVQIIPFYKVFSGKKWEKFNSEKVAALAYARIQGKAALVAHFQNSSLMNEDKRCRPILFCTDGPNAGEQEPFPMGANIQFKPSKARSSFDENNNQGSPSTSATGEGCPNELDSSSSARELDSESIFQSH